MDEAIQKLVLGWLAKANQDLSVARLLIIDENGTWVQGLTTANKPLKRHSRPGLHAGI